MDIETTTDYLIDLLRNINKPLNLIEIANYLNIKESTPESKILRQTIDQLIRNNVLVRTKNKKYQLKNNWDKSNHLLNNFQGIIEISGDTGILITDDPKNPKIIIRRRNFNTALDGDTVEVRLLAQRENKKPRGEVIKVLSRAKIQIIGTVEFDGEYFFLVPDDSKYYVDFLIPRKFLKDASSGDKVSAEMIKWDDPTRSPIAEVIEVLGKTGNPQAEFNSIIKEFDLYNEFHPEVLKEIENIKKPLNRAYAKRLDLRKDIIFTIDPEDAKDFDDAVSLRILENNNYLLGVHIADVSHYIPENSITDIEARRRGTSVYLVDRVLPMIPEKLSNEICSLQPNQPRFTFSSIMEFTQSGKLVNYNISESIIISKRRFSYAEVDEIIKSGKGTFADTILQMNQLAKILRQNRLKNGGVDFRTLEYQFVLDENYYPIKMLEKKSTPATQLIEEFMLITNKTVAEHLKKISKDYKLLNSLPFIYRVHDLPDEDKLQNVLNFIENSTNTKTHKRNLTSKQLNEILEKFKGSPIENTVNQLMIRAMAKAEYSEKNIGHFGLGFKDYSQFTSPIRRYPDLFIHRALKEYLKGKPKQDRINYLNELATQTAQISTEREIIAQQAERASAQLAFLFITNDKIGEVYDGTVTGVTTWGIYVKLDELNSEGLVRLRDLVDDFYFFDEKKMKLVGRHTKKEFGFGSRIRVIISSVDFEKRQITLVYEGK
ncbi:MAG: ribonuclease R [Chloroherpetonaceae bacterium]